ncbi:hypothetical protein [Micromonospora sp. 4G55]|uniref:hypothetical protein n=1 Tax=Micromonospora sp. 4G55 TaxID=2806102 RepID=UPI001A3FED96|nr:hypothetical protein [Micromonospora sp. 4G55]MBM0259524.1 hypothetical protein [Micromonospora sp. 4G55]
MSCCTLIGVTATGGAYAVLWLHWGSEPEQMIPKLRRIWQHTFHRRTDAAVQALLRHDWVSIDRAAARTGRLGERLVPGVGCVSDLQDGLRSGRLDDPVDGYLEWMYLVDSATDTVIVYEATCHGRWLLHSRHLLDPDGGGRVLGCGGHTDDGHQWAPAQVHIPAGGRGLDADVCQAAHPGAATVLRFSDVTAHGICAATAPTSPPAGGQVWWLRPTGAEFDLMWGNGGGDRPHRLRRDGDGCLLLDVSVPAWTWRLLPDVRDGAGR